MPRLSRLLLSVALAAAIPPTGVAAQDPQHAEPSDIHVFDPFIGRFRSESERDAEQGVDVHYELTLSWFDSNRSIVRYRVERVVPSESQRSINSEGYYAYDPFNEVLSVFGVFAFGSSGWGTVGEFDADAHNLTIWGRQMLPDGNVLHVRDGFRLIDENSWQSRILIRVGEDDEWRENHVGIYTRIQESEDMEEGS